MPGATFMPVAPSGIPGVAQQQAASLGGADRAVARAYEATGGRGMPVWTPAFLAWVVIFGLVVPAVILGGLRVGGFRFVFIGR